MSLKELIDAVSTLGTLGFALVAVYAFLTEKVVPRRRLDEMRIDKDKALAVADKAIDGLERLADLEEAREKARRRR